MFVGKVRIIAVALLCGLPLMVYAEMTRAEDEEPEALAPKAIYLPIKPSFVVNYGGEGRLKYIKADLTVRLETSEAAASVRHHLPYVRNNVVRLFSSQTDETLESQEGKELLRQEVLKEIQKIIMEEDGVEGVKDVLFNALIVQK